MHSFLLPSVIGVTSLVGYDDGRPVYCVACTTQFMISNIIVGRSSFVYDDPLIFQPGVHCVAYTTSAVRCYAVTS